MSETSGADEPVEGESKDDRDRAVDLTKGSTPDPAADEPFDPYRFGRPDHPVPPEFAPPGYVPDPVAAPPQWPGASGYPPPGPPGPGQPYEPYVSPYPWNAPNGPSPYGPSPYGPSPYGPSPYGQPPYAQPTGNGKAVTALVLGIGSIVMFWTSILDAILGITAIVFGVIALNEHRARANRPGAGGSPSARKGMAVAGLICAGVGIALAIVWTIVIVRVSNQCGGLEQQNSNGFQQCVQNRLFD